jgi:uncharacterized protein
MKLPVFSFLILKLSTRCNLKCTYCYWFQDESVYEKPKILLPEVERVFLIKLEEHINHHSLQKFSILFHGGEPLLFGKTRFVQLVDRLRDIESRTSCKFHLSITTNGALLDQEWAVVFRALDVHPTLSIDGSEEIHDLLRVDHAGNGSYSKTLNALYILREHGIEPGVLAVCNPDSNPEKVTEHFVKKLDLKHFDILIPDATHESSPPSIAAYYKRLFDLWYDNYSKKGIEIRSSEAMFRGILGVDSHLESIGYGPIQTCAMLTDGSLEPLDVLRIAGYRATETDISILTHTFQDITTNPVWLEAFNSAFQLCDTCKSCEYRFACGGGYLPHRWSKENRFNNPSVYCGDLKEVFDHIWERITPDVDLVTEEGTIPLREALLACS